MRFDAIVLAADRGRNDPVAAAAGVAAKCLTPIAGSPMVVRVVRALEQSGCVHRIVLCGPAAEALQGSPELQRVGDGRQRPLDGSAGHARHQRRRRPRHASGRDPGAAHDRRPCVAQCRDGAPFSAGGERDAAAILPWRWPRTTSSGKPIPARDAPCSNSATVTSAAATSSRFSRRAPGGWRAFGSRWKTTARSPSGSSASSAGSRWHGTRSAR